jgi:hypothetical protein
VCRIIRRVKHGLCVGDALKQIRLMATGTKSTRGQARVTRRSYGPHLPTSAWPQLPHHDLGQRMTLQSQLCLEFSITEPNISTRRVRESSSSTVASQNNVSRPA